MNTSKLLLTASLVVILCMVALIWFFPSNGDFRVENPFWNGLSTFSSQSKITSVNSFSDLPSDSSGTTLFLVPYEPFSDDELSQLKGYVSGGGTLVV